MVASFVSTDIESCEPQQHPRHRISPAQKDHAGGPAGSRTLRTSVAPTANWLASDCSCDHSPTTPGLSCLVGAGQTPTASVSRLTSFERSEVKVCCWSASAARSSSICRFTCGEGGNKPRRQTAVTHPRATQHPHPMRCRSYLGQLRHHRAGLLGAEQLRAGGALPDRHRVAAHVQLRWVERRRGVRCSRCEKRTKRAWFIRLCSELEVARRYTPNGADGVAQVERGISSRGPSAPFLTFLEPRFRRRRTALRSGSDCEPPICASRPASSASSAAAGGASRRRRRRTLLLLRSLRASAPPPPRSGDSSLLLPPTGVSAVRGAARAESAVARFRPGAMPAERKGSFPAGGFREAGANRCGYGSSRRCEFNGSAILAAAVILLAILAG